MAARARTVQGALHASSLLALTQRAIKCRSAALHHAPDRAGAAWGRERLAGAIIDAEIVLKIAELTIGAAVIAQRGTACGDRLGEHGLDGIDEPLCPLIRAPGSARNRGGPSLWRGAGAGKGFAYVNISQPAHDPLIRDPPP